MEGAWLSVLLLTVVCTASAQFVNSENDCDWDVWDTTAKQGVHSVTAHCTSGQVGWHHPYGAVRVLFSLPRQPGFVLCFTATSIATTATVSLETVNKASGDVTLDRLVTLDGGEKSAKVQEVCVESSKGEQVELYIEAEMDHKATVIGHVELEYDMEPLSKQNQEQKDIMEECRPCTDEELLLAVCSSDFVVQGEMSSIRHVPEVDETQIHVQVTKMHRQSRTIFQQEMSSQDMSQTEESLSSETSLHNIINSGTQLRTSDILLKKSLDTRSSTKPQLLQTDVEQIVDKGYTGSVIAPHKCGIRSGKGQYLFMGRIRLKRAMMKCAPRVEDFAEVYKRAAKEGRQKCSFQV